MRSSARRAWWRGAFIDRNAVHYVALAQIFQRPEEDAAEWIRNIVVQTQTLGIERDDFVVLQFLAEGG